MILSLVGMSGSGKTHWSNQMEAAGFKRYGCDDMIEKQLHSELKQMGYAGIHDVAKWMGHPFEPQYEKHSRRYLQLEREVMLDIFASIENATDNDNIIIDTTGSVIYTGEEIINLLKAKTNVVHLSVPNMMMQDMYEQFLNDPKPVIWGNSYKKLPNEESMQALQRCYPELLTFRSEKYKQMAHMTFSYFLLRSEDFAADHFVERLQTFEL